MQEHIWIVEYVNLRGEWDIWNVFKTRIQARAEASCLEIPTRIRKFIAA